jgi:hypothetical protein
MTLAPPARGVPLGGAPLVQTQRALCIPAGVLGDRLPKACAPPRSLLAVDLVVKIVDP